eukprot:2625398-Rhodomonas_salina.1
MPSWMTAMPRCSLCPPCPRPSPRVSPLPPLPSRSVTQQDTALDHHPQKERKRGASTGGTWMGLWVFIRRESRLPSAPGSPWPDCQARSSLPLSMSHFCRVSCSSISRICHATAPPPLSLLARHARAHATHCTHCTHCLHTLHTPSPNRPPPSALYIPPAFSHASAQARLLLLSDTHSRPPAPLSTIAV